MTHEIEVNHLAESFRSRPDLFQEQDYADIDGFIHYSKAHWLIFASKDFWFLIPKRNIQSIKPSIHIVNLNRPSFCVSLEKFLQEDLSGELKTHFLFNLDLKFRC